MSPRDEECSGRISADTNSMILAINQIALAEGLALGGSLGIDPLLLHNVINTASGESACLFNGSPEQSS